MVIKCGIVGCPCTHTEPCEAGWVTVQLDERTGVNPCPTCRPKLAAIFKQFKNDPDGFDLAMRQYRRTNPDTQGQNRVL